MLITNTPNNELHIFNNEGEEIVTIDGTGVTKPDVSGAGGGENLITVELTDEEFADLQNTPVVKEIPEITDFSFAALNKTSIGISHDGIILILKLMGFANEGAVWNMTEVSDSIPNTLEDFQAVYAVELPGYITIRKLIVTTE